MSELSDFFRKFYPPDKPREAISEDFVDRFDGSLPPALLELFLAEGLGKHREGLLELIDPAHYQQTYTDFLGGEAAGRTPFMLNAFGEPVAYRRISAREGEISILHTYGPQLEVLAYDLGDFFDRVLGSDDGLRQVVNISLFGQLKSRLGRLRSGQAYGFDPALLADQPAGTKADASYFEVVEAHAHMALLLRRAQD